MKKHHADTPNGVKNPYLLPIEEVLKRLGSRISGLTSDEAERNLVHYGPNLLKESRRQSLFHMLLEQYKDPMVLLLLSAAVISGMIGEVYDTIVILVIVVLNSIIGFVQEFRAEKAIESLKKMAAPWAVVRRDGVSERIPADQVVPGDVVLLEAGQIVPADMRLIEIAALQVDESPLTGESVPVEKITATMSDSSANIGDRVNMAFKGTIVTYGRGAGVVTATGMATEMGKIATLIEEADILKTPLQKRLVRVGRNLALAALGICGVVFITGILRGDEPVLMLLTAISLAVAAVPEALPAVVTIALALGAKQMVKDNVLIRRLPAVETLGSVTTICTDKTGTLTLNRMQVERVVGHDLSDTSLDQRIDREQANERSWLLALSLALCNDVRPGRGEEPEGDPTEIALYNQARKFGLLKEELQKEYPRVGEIPFSSERQAMTTFHSRPGGGFLSITKGSFEAVSQMCKGLDIKEAEMKHLELAEEGLRILVYGARIWESMPEAITPEIVEKDLVFIGMTGALDPPRPEAEGAVSKCLQAGIRPVMITGDHPVTARAIARRLGIIREEDDYVATGRELEKGSVESLSSKIQRIRVFARVAPEQKLRLVAALQQKGEAVAMTGDGVNDAPALKQAEIGIAMGINGTDVAKDASDMILLDDNFASIVKSVEEGRRIYDNIRKFFRYTLTSNSGEIWTIFLAPFLGMPVPLLPIHILWVNLITDGLPGLAFSVERAEADIMVRPPRPPAESLFAKGMWQHILFVGLFMGAICLVAQAWALETQRHWQTMVFTILCFSQFGHALAIRSERESVFKWGLASNRFLFVAILLSIGLQLAVIYHPFLQKVFHTSPLTLKELFIVFLASTSVFWIVELEKFVVRKGWLRYR